MTHRLTILGCGSSGGVPRIGAMWGHCDPENPKNRRRRCAVMIERFGENGTTRVLVDTPPDVREQLLDMRVAAIDAVVFTHDHADHTHGIDDLRMVAYAMKRRIDAYFDAPTRKSLEDRFGYCFSTPKGSGYAPILNSRDIAAGASITVDGRGGPITIAAIPQVHGDIASLGLRVGRLAYSPDVSSLPEAALPMLQGLDHWIVDALRYTSHPSHFSVKDALGWIERLGVKHGVLTHMTTDLDYAALKRELPPNVEPAYDGMEIMFE
ncbi:MAG: MBL fold metallo-hydrolase [Hyphomicrobiaceae bacterium]|nr:MBL fold metallo-hydrolase [Hyphomicrobiaceae bacterium]